MAVLCDVVEATTAHKIVKIDYIALQCKSLIIKVIINSDRVNINGDTVKTESALTKWSLLSGSGDQYSLRSPAPEGQNSILKKVLDKSLKV